MQSVRDSTMVMMNALRKKAIFTILTTFFFIIMVLIVALGIIYYATVMTNISAKADDKTNRFVVARTMRDSLYYCFGNVLDEERLRDWRCQSGLSANETLNVTTALVKAWKIEKIGLNNCTPESWASIPSPLVPGSYRDRFVYAVPVLERQTYVCLGFLEVYV